MTTREITLGSGATLEPPPPPPLPPPAPPPLNMQNIIITLELAVSSKLPKQRPLLRPGDTTFFSRLLLCYLEDQRSSNRAPRHRLFTLQSSTSSWRFFPTNCFHWSLMVAIFIFQSLLSIYWAYPRIVTVTRSSMIPNQRIRQKNLDRASALVADENNNPRYDPGARKQWFSRQHTWRACRLIEYCDRDSQRHRGAWAKIREQKHETLRKATLERERQREKKKGIRERERSIRDRTEGAVSGGGTVGGSRISQGPAYIRHRIPRSLH